MTSLASDQSNFKPAFSKATKSDFGIRLLVIACCIADGRGQGKTATPELAGVANDDRLPGDLNHDSIDFGLDQVRGGQAKLHIKSVHSEKVQVSTQPMHRVFRQRSDQ